MNEFDLRNFLYNNTLLKEEKNEVSDKARREAEEEGYEDGYDDAIEDAKKALDGIKDESEEEKDKKKDVKEASAPKLTKEGLKNMIREKITSILNEEEITEQEDVEVEDNENVDVDVEKDVNVDVKDEVDVDDESVESDIEVKTEVPGESADTAAVLGLLTKAQEEAEGMGDEVLMDQIGNTITYFTRKHVVKASNEKLEEEEVNELFGFGRKKRARSGGSDSKGYGVFALGKDGERRRIGSGQTERDASRNSDWQSYKRRYAVNKFEMVDNDTGEVVDSWG